MFFLLENLLCISVPCIFSCLFPGVLIKKKKKSLKGNWEVGNKMMQIELCFASWLKTSLEESGRRWLHIYNVWFNWSSARCCCMLMDSRMFPIRNNLPDWKLRVLMAEQGWSNVLLLSYWNFCVPLFIYFTKLEQRRLYFKNLYFRTQVWNPEIWWPCLWVFILVSQIQLWHIPVQLWTRGSVFKISFLFAVVVIFVSSAVF